MYRASRELAKGILDPAHQISDNGGEVKPLSKTLLVIDYLPGQCLHTLHGVTKESPTPLLLLAACTDRCSDGSSGGVG